MHVFADFPSCRRSGIAVLLTLVMAATWSCQRGSTPAAGEGEPPPKPHPVRLIVVDDPPFAAALEREWKARMEGELKLQQMTVEQLESAKQLTADAIIYPSACLGTVAERKLIAAPSPAAYEGDQYAQRDVFELQRNVEVHWGRQAMAFSFGSPQLVLMYRSDLFHKRQLKPPATWERIPAVGRAIDAVRAAVNWLPPKGNLGLPYANPWAAAGRAKCCSPGWHPTRLIPVSSRCCLTTPPCSR